MRTLQHTVLPEDSGRMIKAIVRGRMGVSHKQFTSAKMKDEIATKAR